MYVYFIQEGRGKHGSIKIGKSSNINKRLKSLQTGNPRKLTLMATIKCTTPNNAHRLESKLHLMFKADRVRGEWFNGLINLNLIQETFEIEPDNYEKARAEYIDAPSKIKKKSKRIKGNLPEPLGRM